MDATDTQRHQRLIWKATTDVLVGLGRQKTTKNKKESFDQYGQALDSLKQKKKKAGRNGNEQLGAADTHCHQHLIWNAIRDVLVQIGKVHHPRLKLKDPIDADVELCIDDGSKLDLIGPLNDDETVSSASDEMAFVSISEPTITSPIILPTLPPMIDTDLDVINAKKRDNCTYISHEIRNNLSDDKSTKNSTN